MRGGVDERQGGGESIKVTRGVDEKTGDKREEKKSDERRSG